MARRRSYDVYEYSIKEMFAERYFLFGHSPRDLQATDTAMDYDPAWEAS